MENLLAPLWDLAYTFKMRVAKHKDLPTTSQQFLREQNAPRYSSSLLSLPSELKEEIISFLDLPSVRACRLVSKEMKEHARRSFRAYLANTYVALNTVGLAKLVEISRHEDFCSAVQGIGVDAAHRLFNPADYNDDAMAWIMRTDELPPPFALGYTSTMYWASQSGLITALFTHALSNLPCVQDIWLESPTSDLWHPSRPRNRGDGIPYVFGLAPYHTYSLMLAAFMASDTKLQSFEWPSSEFYSGFGLDRSSLLFTVEHKDGLGPIFQNLSHLDLTVGMITNNETGNMLLAEILGLMPALTTLSLVFEGNEDRNYLLEGVSKVVTLPKLQSLSLEHSDELPSSIILPCLSLARKHSATLKDLSLYYNEGIDELHPGTITNVILPVLEAFRDDFRLEEVYFEPIWYGGHGEEWLAQFNEKMQGLWPINAYGGEEAVKKILAKAINALHELDL